MAIKSSLLLTECQSSTTSKRNLKGSVGDNMPILVAIYTIINLHV